MPAAGNVGKNSIDQRVRPSWRPHRWQRERQGHTARSRPLVVVLASMAMVATLLPPLPVAAAGGVEISGQITAPDDATLPPFVELLLRYGPVDRPGLPSSVEIDQDHRFTVSLPLGEDLLWGFRAELLSNSSDLVVSDEVQLELVDGELVGPDQQPFDPTEDTVDLVMREANLPLELDTAGLESGGAVFGDEALLWHRTRASRSAFTVTGWSRWEAPVVVGDGGRVLLDLPDGDHVLRFLPDRIDDGPPATTGFVSVSVDDGVADVAGASLVVSEGNIRGRLLAPTGVSELDGYVTLRALDNVDRLIPALLESSTSNVIDPDDGRFSFHVPPGEYELQGATDVDGLVATDPVRITVDTDGTADPPPDHDLQLRTSALTVEVEQVAFGTGQLEPCVNCFVRATLDQDGSSLSMVTNEDGVARLTLDPGRWSIQAGPQRYGGFSLSQTVDVAATGEAVPDTLRFELPAPTYELRLLERDGVTDCLGCELVIEEVVDGAVDGAWDSAQDDAGIVRGQLDDGRWLLRSWSLSERGVVSDTLDIEVVDGQIVGELPSSLALEVPNLQIELRDLSGELRAGEVIVDHLDGVPGRRLPLQSEHGSLATWVPDGESELSGDLFSEGGGWEPVVPRRITVTGGQPTTPNPHVLTPEPPNVIFRLQDPDGDAAVGSVRVLQVGDPFGFQSGVTDEDGIVGLVLDDGRYEVIGELGVGLALLPSETITIEVVDGDATVMDDETALDAIAVTLRATTVHGQRLAADGEPRSGIDLGVRVLDNGGSEDNRPALHVGPNGHYAVVLDPGHYEIQALPGQDSTLGAPSTPVEVVIDENGEPDVELPLDLRLRDANLWGQVSDPSGGSVESTVRAQPVGGGLGVTASTDADGRYALLLTEDGEYELWADPNQPSLHGPSDRTTITVAAGVPIVDAASEPTLDLQLTPGNVDGVVLEFDDSAAAGTFLTIEPTESWVVGSDRRRSLIADQDGRWGTALPDGTYRILDPDRGDVLLDELVMEDATPTPASPVTLQRRDPSVNIPPEISSLSLVPARGPEPLTVELRVAVDDPDDDTFTYTVDWGDGSEPEVFEAAGDFLEASYTFDTWGTYEVDVEVDDGQDTDQASTTATALATTTVEVVRVAQATTTHGEGVEVDVVASSVDPDAGIPTGTVVVETRGARIDVARSGTLDADGRATVTLGGGNAAMSAGQLEIGVRYVGDTQRSPSTSEGTASHTVLRADTEASVVTTPRWVEPDQAFAVTAGVEPVAPGGGTPQGSLDLTIRPLEPGRTPALVFEDVTGPIEVPAGLPRGDYAVNVTYNGSDDHRASTQELRLVSSPLRRDPTNGSSGGGLGGGGGWGGGGSGGGSGGDGSDGNDADPIAWRSFPPSSGMLVDVATSEYLHCLARFDGDLLPAVETPDDADLAGGDLLSVAYEPPEQGTGCFTVIVVDGQVHAPPAAYRPTDTGLFVSGYRPVSQSGVSGEGTAADPWEIRTVVGLGDPEDGITATQVDRFYDGAAATTSTISLDGVEANADVEIRQLAYCQVSNDHRGYLTNDEDAGAVGCRSWAADEATGEPTARGERALVMQPVSTPDDPRGSGYRYDVTEELLAEVLRSDAIERRATGCETEVDNAIAVALPAAAASFSMGYREVTDEDCVERPGTRPTFYPPSPSVLTVNIALDEWSEEAVFEAVDDDPLPVEITYEVREALGGGPPVEDVEVECDGEPDNPATLTCRFRTDVEGVFRVVATATDADGREVGPRTLRLEGRTGGGIGVDGFRYAILGDSYSSGEGAGDYLSPTDSTFNLCHRSAVAYGPLLASWADDLVPDLQQTFTACSGAVADDLFTPVGGDDRVGQLEQVIAIHEDTDLVTLSMGGNDVGFGPILAYCLGAKSCQDTFTINGEDAIANAIDGVAGEIADALGELRELSNATVTLVGYPQIFSSDSHRCLSLPERWDELLGDGSLQLPDELWEIIELILDDDFSVPAGGSGLGPGEIAWIRARTSQMNQRLEAAAAAAGVNFVDIEDVLEDHLLCDGVEHAVNPFARGPIDLLFGDASGRQEWFHPSAPGHRSMASAMVGGAANPVSRELNPLPGSPLDPVVDRPRFRVGTPGALVLGLGQTVGLELVDAGVSASLKASLGPFGKILADPINTTVEGLVRNAAYELLLHSDPTSLGVFVTDGDGRLVIEAEWPDEVEAGYHVLDLTGPDPDGNEGDLLRMVVPLIAVPDVLDGVTIPDIDDDGSQGPEDDGDDAPSTPTQPGGGTAVPDAPNEGEGGDAESEVPLTVDREVILERVAELCPRGLLAELPFWDLTGQGTHDLAIACAADRGLVRGFADGSYGSPDPMTRGQVASVLADLAVELGVELPAGLRAFVDTPGTTHGVAIEQLAAAGVLHGVGEDRFAPNAPVRRGQFATMLVGVHALVEGRRLAGDRDHDFRDVAGTTHAGAIAAAAAAGLTDGVTPDRFEPSGTVTRGQSASFAIRLLAWFQEEP